MNLLETREALEGYDLDIIAERHPLDPMYKYNPSLYGEAGHVALRHIRLALLTAQRPDLPAFWTSDA